MKPTSLSRKLYQKLEKKLFRIIRGSAFKGCPLTDVDFSDRYNFGGIEDGNLRKIVTKLEKITIPDGTTEIKGYAFQGFKKLNEVIIPDTVTQIGNCAFRNCISLKNVQLPNHLLSLGNYAFAGCKKLQKIDLPPTLLR